MSKAKVAICVPSHETWKAKMGVCLSNMRVFSTLSNTGTQVINFQCSIITMSRNYLVRKALAFEPQATHVLFVDSDMVYPQESLEVLLSRDKDIVGAFYNRRTPPYTTVGHLIGSPDISKGGLQEADIMPMGFTLIKRHVFETIKAPWYYEHYDPAKATEDDPDGTVGEDVGFSIKALAAGFQMWCDLDLTFEMRHLGEAEVPCLRPEPITTSFRIARAA